jgi:hypothetical protein
MERLVLVLVLQMHSALARAATTVASLWLELLLRQRVCRAVHFELQLGALGSLQ